MVVSHVGLTFHGSYSLPPKKHSSSKFHSPPSTRLGTSPTWSAQVPMGHKQFSGASKHFNERNGPVLKGALLSSQYLYWFFNICKILFELQWFISDNIARVRHIPV